MTKQCNALLQHILDQKRITLPDSAHNPANFRATRNVKDATPDSQNPVFVHLVQQILWENKERELAEPEMRKQGRFITNKSDLQIAGEMTAQWLKDQGLLTVAMESKVENGDQTSEK